MFNTYKGFVLKKHTKIYIAHFGGECEEYVPCEICENPAVDVHHIDARGMGGTNDKDTIENLMGLCRECHQYFGDKVRFKRMLRIIHEYRLKSLS